MSDTVKITESPRDGMQSFHKIISLPDKIDYLNTLMQVGFDMIDIGSFVSKKAIPQTADTGQLIDAVEMSDSKISVLAANATYAEKAVQYDKVTYVSYPFSVSEIFLQKNLKSDFKKSEKIIDDIVNLSQKYDKQLIISLSMAFGNPYGELYSLDILHNWVEKLQAKGIHFISLADTVASGNADLIFDVFTNLKANFTDIEFNLHIHTLARDIDAKLEAAFAAGCRNFDTVFNGLGGCPMSGKELIANLETMQFVNFLDNHKIKHKLNREKLILANKKASQIFS